MSRMMPHERSCPAGQGFAAFGCTCSELRRMEGRPTKPMLGKPIGLGPKGATPRGHNPARCGPKGVASVLAVLHDVVVDFQGHPYQPVVRRAIILLRRQHK